MGSSVLWSPLITPDAVWISITIIVCTCQLTRGLTAQVIVGVNVLGVRAYGEAEFWLALGKVLLITGLISALARLSHTLTDVRSPRHHHRRCAAVCSAAAFSVRADRVGRQHRLLLCDDSVLVSALKRTDWQNPGPLVQYDGIQGELGRFLGFFAVLIQAVRCGQRAALSN